MATVRAPWEQMICICPQTSGIGSAGTFLTTDDCIETGKPGTPVFNRDFNISPGLRWIEERQAYGKSNIETAERKVENEFPTISLEMPFNAYTFSVILWLFFQKGVSEAGSTPYLKTAVPYTDADCEVWASVADPITGGLASGSNEAMHGAIVNSFTINGEEGGQMKLSADFIGVDFTELFNTASAVTVVSEQSNLLYKNCTIELDDNTIYIPSFSITFNNGAETPSYNTSQGLKHVLQDLEVTGELTIPRDSGNSNEDDEAQITDLLAKTTRKLEIYWGAMPAASEGDVSLLLDIIHKDKEKVHGVEIGNRLPFEQQAGSNNLSIKAADAIDRGIA